MLMLLLLMLVLLGGVAVAVDVAVAGLPYKGLIRPYNRVRPYKAL